MQGYRNRIMLYRWCRIDEVKCVFGNLGFRLLFSIVRACAGFEIFRGFLLKRGKDAVRGFTGYGEIYGCRVLVDSDRAERVVEPIKLS